MARKDVDQEIRDALLEAARKRNKPKISIYIAPDVAIYGKVTKVGQNTVWVDTYDLFSDAVIGRVIVRITDILYIDVNPVSIYRQFLESMYCLENAPKTKDDDDGKKTEVRV